MSKTLKRQLKAALNNQYLIKLPGCPKLFFRFFSPCKETKAFPGRREAVELPGDAKYFFSANFTI
jgi:hypothetical protein